VTDPIADPAVCKRDIAEFKKLGINTIRIYSVDNTANHDTCMQALADAGIYLVLDVNSPKYSINRNTPHNSYNTKYLQNIFATIDAFAGYTNTLAFFSGNEVINMANNTNCAPYVKAVTRDMRQYIGSRGYRKIPVGYSAADVAENRMEMAAYMNCGTDDERSDFFAFNDYSWCSPSSFTQSGWDQKVKNFTGYGLPIFLSEYGCITNTRTWEEAGTLYTSKMTGVYSGGLAYEYSMEENGYGMVQINGNSVSELTNFKAFQSQLAANPSPSGDGGYNPNGGSSQCPAKSANWDVADDNLPAIPTAAALFMKNGAGKGDGLQGPGSQDSTDTGTSPSSASAGSGSVTAVASGSATSKSAAGMGPGPIEKAPLIVGSIFLGFFMLGGLLL
jgi:hypothetical protein